MLDTQYTTFVMYEVPIHTHNQIQNQLQKPAKTENYQQ